MANISHYLGLENTDRAEKLLFVVTALFTLALSAAGVLYPNAVGKTLNDSFTFVITYFNWWFILLSLIIVVFLIGFALSKYGRLRIGGEDAEPEFGLFSWLAMVFTVGFSISVLFWGVAEPLYIVNSPPQPAPVQGTPIEVLALAFMFIHDILPGLIAWYLPFAVAFGLVAWNKGNWKVSTLLEPVLDREKYGPVFTLVDLVTLIAIVGGIATSLGFIGKQLSSIIGIVFGIQSQAFTIAVFGAVAVVFLLDVIAGLEKGIRNAARLTVVANIVLTVALLLLGPTLYILELGLDATGVWLNYMPRLMLFTNSGAADSLWVNNWTGFWWAWWAAWGVFVGSFVARVSKGRTVREVFIGLGIVPTTLLVFQHSVLGGWAMQSGNIDEITTALFEQGQAAALSTAITLTPYSKAIGLLFVLALVGYLVTSLDSAVYMLAAINTGEREPNARNRAVWGILLVGVGVMTTYLGGGTSALEAFSTTLALPFTLLFVVVLVSTYIYARQQYPDVYTTLNDLLRHVDDPDEVAHRRAERDDVPPDSGVSADGGTESAD